MTVFQYIHILLGSIIFIFAKAILVGSDFSFYHWAKYGKSYRTWYFKRETWKEYYARKEDVRKILALDKDMWGLPLAPSRRKQINKAIQETIEEDE